MYSFYWILVGMTIPISACYFLIRLKKLGIYSFKKKTILHIPDKSHITSFS